MTYKEYKDTWLWKRIDYDVAYWYQCVDLARHYAVWVMWLPSKAFWWSAINWWINRNKVFKWKKIVEWFDATVPVWSIVFFKNNAFVKTKKSWIFNLFWKQSRFTEYGHVWIVDYIDNDWVIRVLEQNWANGRLVNWKRIYDWLWENAIRLYWYKWKESVAWFILP